MLRFQLTQAQKELLHVNTFSYRMVPISATAEDAVYEDFIEVYSSFSVINGLYESFAIRYVRKCQMAFGVSFSCF